jgi:hypothetical protein
MPDQTSLKPRLRFRHGFMAIGSILVIALWLLTDPDNDIVSHLPFGASTIATLLILLKSVLYVTVLHLSRKALMDYLDLKTVMDKAMQTSEGAGQVFIGVGLVFIAIALTIYAAVRF